MQSQLVDKKLAIIFDRYKDRDFAANAQKEVEDIRRKAYRVGALTTGAAFVLNEAARLTMRSRKYLTSQINISLACLKLTYSNSYLQVEGSKRYLLVDGSLLRQQILLR